MYYSRLFSALPAPVPLAYRKVVATIHESPVIATRIADVYKALHRRIDDEPALQVEIELVCVSWPT